MRVGSLLSILKGLLFYFVHVLLTKPENFEAGRTVMD